MDNFKTLKRLLHFYKPAEHDVLVQLDMRTMLENTSMSEEERMRFTGLINAMHTEPYNIFATFDPQPKKAEHDRLLVQRRQLLAMKPALDIISDQIPELDERSQLLGEYSLDSMLDDQSAKQELLKQGQLTEQLAMATARLKANTLIFRETLVKDKLVSTHNKLLTSVDEKMDRNLARIQNERKKISTVSGATWKTTFMVWGSLLLVCIVFGWMMLYIRFIHPSVKLSQPVSTSAYHQSGVSTLAASVASASTIAPKIIAVGLPSNVIKVEQIRPAEHEFVAESDDTGFSEYSNQDLGIQIYSQEPIGTRAQTPQDLQDVESPVVAAIDSIIPKEGILSTMQDESTFAELLKHEEPSLNFEIVRDEL